MRHNLLSITQCLRQSSNLFKPEILNELRSWSVKSSPTIQSIRLHTQFMLHHFKPSALKISEHIFNSSKITYILVTSLISSHHTCPVLLCVDVRSGKGGFICPQVAITQLWPTELPCCWCKAGPGLQPTAELQADWRSSNDKKGKDTDSVTSLHQLFRAARTRL